MGDEVKPRTAAELAALYAQYPGLEESMAQAAYCEWHNDSVKRAYGTGLGSAAHAEAQEAGSLQQEYDNAKPYSEDRRYL